MAQYPNDLKYTKDHEWIREEEDLIKIGITSYAVEQLGDVTLVDLPAVGTDVQAQERFGDIESVKTVSELFAPVSGEVVEVNDELEASPENVNEGPYEQGWMVVIRPSDPAELGRLMDAAAYEEFLGSLDH
jgi:glycine cleavage system H protein